MTLFAHLVMPILCCDIVSTNFEIRFLVIAIDGLI